MPFKDLVFPECPDEPLEWYDWMLKCKETCSATTMRLPDAHGDKITCTYFTIFSIGLHFDRNTAIWAAAQADLARLDYGAINQNCPTLPQGDRALIREELATPVMTIAAHHRAKLRLNCAMH